MLYENTPLESRAIRSLIQSNTIDSRFAGQLSLLIYDNSITAQNPDLGNFHFATFEYKHDPQNGGLAAAYNYALEAAQRRDIDWLLLLDQDTTFDTTLFTALFPALHASPPVNVVAIVPKLMQDGTILSPQVVGRFRNNPIKSDFSGICPVPVTAFNSAACLRVRAVAAAGGFPQEYRLDYLDHIMFHRLQAAGGRVLVLDVILEHRLSLLNLRSEMSVNRYSSVLAAEWKFIKETGLHGGPLLHRLRLLKRTLYLVLRKGGCRHALMALESSFR